MKSPGLVIRKMNMGEADRLLVILTPEHGKVKAMAKGVRRPRAKLAAWLDMFRYNNFELVSGRSFYIVTGAQTIKPLIGEATSWDRLAVAYYICELVDQLVEEGHSLAGVFELACDALAKIGEGKIDEKLIRASFEMKLLGLLGINPQLARCVVSGKELAPEGALAFSCRLGGVLAGEEAYRDDFGRPVSINAVKLMRLLGQYPLEAITQIKIEEADIAAAVSCISDFVSYTAETRSKSLKVAGELAR